MAQPTISVLDSGGTPVVINTINPNGQALAADSQPVVLTAAQIATLTPPAAITGFATSANQSTQITAEQAILAKIIAAPATEAKQDTQVTAQQAILAKIIAAPATEAKQDTGITSLASIDTKLTSQATAALQGALTETAPATDTASAGMNGRLQRIAQRLTSLIALLPSVIGQAAKAASLSVVLASDDDIQAKLGIVTETAPATDTASSGLNGRMQRVAQRVTSLIALLPTALSNLGLAVSSQPAISTSTITRPANVTAYTTGDVVGGALTFATIGPSGGHIRLEGIAFMLNIGAVPAGMSTFRLHLYDVTPPSAIADNGVFDLPSGDRASYLGYVELGSPALIGASTVFVQYDGVAKQIKLNASTSLFGYLETRAGYTPAANSEVYNIAMKVTGV